MSKIKIDDIRETLHAKKWDIKSETYENLDSELLFVCDEGHEFLSTWRKMRTKLECPICKKNQYKQKFKVTQKRKGVTRILALDQATHLTGWSILDNKKLIAFGAHDAGEGNEIERFHAVKNWLISMIDNWNPDCIAIEGIQFQQYAGVTTFQTLARLQGILMELCYELNIPFEICPTPTWRAHCGVKGRTRNDRKTSIKKLVKQWYDITVSEDEADAIGIGKFLSETWSGLQPPPQTMETWE